MVWLEAEDRTEAEVELSHAACAMPSLFTSYRIPHPPQPWRAGGLEQFLLYDPRAYQDEASDFTDYHHVLRCEFLVKGV